MAGQFIINRGKAAYVPARTAIPYLQSGTLHLVADAPVFPFPIYGTWWEDMDPDVLPVMLEALREAGADADEAQEDVLELLTDVSESNTVELLSIPDA